MWLPGRVREADGERRSERAEVSRHVGVGAGRVAQHQSRDALDEHHHGDPREGGPHPVRPAQARRTRSRHHPIHQVGNHLRRADAERSVERLEPLGEELAIATGGEMPLGGVDLAGERFTVEPGRQHVVNLVAFHFLPCHVVWVGVRGDLVPGLQH